MLKGGNDVRAVENGDVAAEVSELWASSDEAGETDRAVAAWAKTPERKTMMTMCKAVQEAPTMVRLYWGNNVKGASRPGELIGYGPDGCVIKFGGLYRIFAADARQIGNAMTEIDWNKRKWELRSAYWCEK